MKKIRFLISACLSVAVALILIGCNKSQLSAPRNLSVTDKTLSWSAVENASGYIVEINDESYQIRKTYYSFETLYLPEGDYVFKVKAYGNDYSDSDWATVKYHQVAESGLSYKLTDDKKGYIVAAVGRAKNDIVIDDTYNGLPVVGIGYRAFNGNIDITSIELGKNIRYIESRAFFGCKTLTSVTFNDGLESIGEMAFQSCSELESIEIPDSVTEIGDYAFAYCRGSAELKLGSSVKTIGDSAFITNILLEEVTIPSSVEHMGAEAFSNCSKLKTVVFEGKILEVSEKAFLGCTSLDNVDFGECKMQIGEYMFYGCTSLASITLNNKIERIGSYAFQECTSLENVVLGDAVTSIGQSVFYGSGLFNNSKSDIVLADDWIVGVKNSADVADDDFSEIQNLNIVGIADYSFRNCTEIYNLISLLPDSLKYIGASAFISCKNLQTIVISENVTQIGDYAFIYCESLNSVIMESDKIERIGKYAFAYSGLNNINKLPESLNQIGTYAFYESAYWKEQFDGGLIIVDKWVVGCNPATTMSVTVQSGIVGVADYAFSYCEGLRSVELPATVKCIGEGAFYGCAGKYDGEETLIPVFRVSIPDGITEIRPYTFYASALSVCDLPSSVKSIGYAAFAGTMLGSMYIPDSVTEIDAYAFWMCAQLQVVTLPDNLTTIKSNVFNSCENLKAVSMPDTVTEICDNAFFRCDKLSDINFGTGLKRIGDYAFYMCLAFENIELPDSVTEIGEYAFYKCTSLQSIDLSGSLKSIGDYAFYGCAKLSNIVFPQSLESIGESAFRTCLSLSGIILNDNIISIGAHAFYGNRNITFYSEAGSAPESWDDLWNSTYRPVVWNCTFDETKTYVVSVEKSAISNYNAINGIYKPLRAGYEFSGWAADADSGVVLYGAEELYLAYDGTVLYAVWESKS